MATQEDKMDRNALPPGEEQPKAGPSDPAMVLKSTPSADMRQTTQLLPKAEADINDAANFPDRFEMCWCCPIYRCVCGGFNTNNPQPLQTRTLDCISHFLFWCSGMYAPGDHFSRWRWNCLNDLNKTRAGRFSKLKVTSFDSSIASSYVAGLRIPVRVYEPDSDDPNKRFGPFVFYHGGGFCIGDAAMSNFDLLCAKLASKCQVVVISVSYRLAPEHPFPAAIQDCHDCVRRLTENPSALSSKIDITKGIIVGGDSAGGNASCVVSSLCRDNLDADLNPLPLNILIRHQLLIYPALFMQRFIEADFADGSAFIPKQVMGWFRLSYLPDAKTIRDVERMSLTERRLCPFVAGFEGLPPTTIVSAGLDHLRHENIIAAQQFVLAGVDCVHHHVENVPHAFMTFHFLREMRETLELVVKDIFRETRVPAPPKKSEPPPPRQDSLLVGSKVEIIQCLGAVGRVKRVRESETIAEIDLGWGTAYVPTSNLLVLGEMMTV